MTLRELRRGYTPLLLTFITPHLIVQTDLVMLSRLGETATAAYVIPIRIALLDTILAMALGSVTAAVVADARRGQEIGGVVYGILGIAVITGSATATIGFFTYSHLALWVTTDEKVTEFTQAAVPWYAATALFRQLSSVAMMTLHALDKATLTFRWRLLEVGLNALLNHLFIFKLGFGFSGAYQSTLLVNAVACFWSVPYLLFRFKQNYRLLGSHWTHLFFHQCKWEIKRLGGVLNYN